MELNHLRSFYLVAREGGFTRAARLLRVQQPAVSKMVRSLEQSLDLLLLERHKQRVRLTAAGEEIYRQCVEIFARVDNIAALAERDEATSRGPLRFGASDVIASHLLVGILADYRRQHPLVKPAIFTGTSGAIVDEILAHRLEFGLFFTATEQLHGELLTEVAFKLVAAPSWRQAAPALASFIGSRDIDYSKARRFPVMEMLQGAGLSVEVAIASNNLQVQYELVLAGAGAALLPDFMVAEALRRRRLKVLHPHKHFSYGLRLASHKTHVLSPNAARFVALLRARLGD